MVLGTEVHDINELLNEKNLNPIITNFLGCMNRLPLIEIQPVFQTEKCQQGCWQSPTNQSLSFSPVKI